MTVIEEVVDKGLEARKILDELYQMIDEIFLSYVVSLEALRVWRPHLKGYEEGYRQRMLEEGVEDAEIERRIEQQDHFIPPEGEFKLQVNTKKIRKVLAPGVFENLQAKNAIKIVYDAWDSPYRDDLEKLVGEQIQSDIWGELGWIRQSIVHRNSKGVDKLKKAKLITAFKPGQEIIFTPEIMEQIRQELENWYRDFQLKCFSPRR
jgi:hypothetical protein